MSRNSACARMWTRKIVLSCVLIVCLISCGIVCIRCPIADNDLQHKVSLMRWPYEWTQGGGIPGNIFWGCAADWTETEKPMLIEYNPDTATNLGDVVEKLRAIGVKTIGLCPKYVLNTTDREMTSKVDMTVDLPDPAEKYRGNSIDARLERIKRDCENSEWSRYLIKDFFRNRHGNTPATPHLLIRYDPVLFFQMDDVHQIQKGEKWFVRRINRPLKMALYIRIEDNPEVLKRNVTAFPQKEAQAFCRFVQTLMIREKFPYEISVRDSWTGRERFIIPKKGKGEIIVLGKEE